MKYEEPFQLIQLVDHLPFSESAKKKYYTIKITLTDVALITISYYDIQSRNRSTRSFSTQKIIFSILYTETIFAEYIDVTITPKNLKNTGKWSIYTENKPLISEKINFSEKESTHFKIFLQ